MFAHLAKQFSSGSAGNGEVQQQQQQGLPESDFASLEDAQYVQAVIEAVRRSSREKAWTKVIVKAGLEVEVDGSEPGTPLAKVAPKAKRERAGSKAN